MFVNKEILTSEDVHLLVKSTNGFFARDWDLGLGWNNMRYIIETALLQARLLNRTLILPSFVYARGCQYEYHVCGDYAPMVNKGDAVGSDEWRELPIEQQMAWMIPIEIMLNITHLRETHPVITTTDYLLLHGYDPSEENTSGYWKRTEYHTRANVITGTVPSFYAIENPWYDPEGTIRVDTIPEAMQARADNHSRVLDGSIDSKLRQRLPEGKSILEWDTVQSALNSTDEAELERGVVAGGWEVLYTYDSIVGLDYNKAVVSPIKQIAPLSTIHSFDQFGNQTQDVILMAGGVHYGRKPGSMLFTTREAQDEFARIVMYDMKRIDPLLDLAETLVERMYEITEGRQWMAVHMRRGDFVRYGWVMESTPEAHMSRVIRHLDEGREILSSLNVSDSLRTYDVPGLSGPNDDTIKHPPSLADDWFFVATDERDPKVLDYFRGEGAVFMDDIMTIADRRAFGEVSDVSWALMISDVRALVEQVILSRAAFFYGHAMSSVPGGVLNLRAMRGADPRTSVID
ncbi:hypothetical protein BDZ89DRAFT_950792 [Hymenopellis radicata]|nr:hypothetical protein BDZ89DRAFT_950792 [Hymenopellis radicata]